MLGAENIAVNKTDQISAFMEFMALVGGRGKTQNIVGTENSKCKVPEAFHSTVTEFP